MFNPFCCVLKVLVRTKDVSLTGKIIYFAGSLNQESNHALTCSSTENQAKKAEI